MVTISKSLVFALTAAITVGTASYGAHAGNAAAQVFKPARGISFDIGSKRAAAYYMAGDHVCDLTLMFAGRADADGNIPGATTRLNVPVKAGTRSRIYTTDGQAFEASCELSAKVMTLRVLEQTAAN